MRNFLLTLIRPFGYVFYYTIYGAAFCVMYLIVMPIRLIFALIDIYIKREYYWYQTKLKIKSFALHSLIKKEIFVIYSVIFVILLFTYFQYNDSIGRLSSTSLKPIISSFLQINSILIGVIMSLIILTFQTLNRKFGQYAFRALFNSIHIRALVTLLILNFFLSTYSIFHLGNSNLSTYSWCLFYVALASNFFLFILAFPLGFLALKSSSKNDHIDGIIDHMDEEWIYKYSTNSFVKAHKQDEIFSLEWNPLKELIQIAKNAISNEDLDSYQLVLKKLNEKLIARSKIDSNKWEFFFYEMTKFIDQLLVSAIKSDEQIYLGVLLRVRGDVAAQLASIPLAQEDIKIVELSLWRIDYDFENYVKKAIQLNKEDYVELILDQYYVTGQMYLRNLIPEGLKEVDRLNYEEDSKLKRFVSSYYGSSISNIMKLLNTERSKGQYTFVFKLFHFRSDVLQSRCSISTKTFILDSIHNGYESCVKEFMKQTSISESPSVHFLPSNFAILKEIQELKRMQILRDFSSTISQILISGSLTNRQVSELRGVTNFIIHFKPTNQNIERPLKLCLECFGKLIKGLEDYGSDKKNMDLYLFIHESVNSIEKELFNKPALYENLKSDILLIYSDFTHLTDYKKELDTRDFVREFY